MAITTSVNSFVNNQISAYRGLAQKAMGTGEVVNQNNSVVAALKRFFYKLDFLLKYGHFPAGVDAAQDALPPELQGLKDFLTVASKKNGGSYILHCNEKERYLFSWSNNELFVSKEEFFPVSPAGARIGYACTGGWRASLPPQECNARILLHMITQNNTWSAKDFDDTFGASAYNPSTNTYSFLPPTSNNFPPLTLKKGEGDNFMEDYQRRMDEIASKDPNYIVFMEANVSSAFTSCIEDFYRCTGSTVRFSGIKIPRSLHKAIIGRILPDYEEQQRDIREGKRKMIVLNTERFSLNEVSHFIELVADSGEDLDPIKKTLQHPQFPLAFLAVGSQGVLGGDANNPVLSHSASLEEYFQNMGVNTSVLSLSFREYSITPPDEGEGLLCQSIIYQPCRIDDDTGKIGIGVSRSCNTFYIPKGFIGKKEHNKDDVTNQLAPLTSTIITAITI